METAKITKKEQSDFARASVIALFDETLSGEFTQIDSGAFVIEVDNMDKTGTHFVEVKFVVKGETFDFEDAQVAFEDKVKKARERETLKETKAAERLKKEADKEAKAAEKATKA